MTQDKDTSEISVVRCYENTPAAESGLLPGISSPNIMGKILPGWILRRS